MTPTILDVDALVSDLSREYDRLSGEYSGVKDELRRAEVSDLMSFIEWELARLGELRQSLTATREREFSQNNRACEPVEAETTQ